MINQQKVCNLTGLLAILGALLFSWVDLNKSILKINATQEFTSQLLNEKRVYYEESLDRYDAQFKEMNIKLKGLVIKVKKLEENIIGNGKS